MEKFKMFKATLYPETEQGQSIKSVEVLFPTEAIAAIKELPQEALGTYQLYLREGYVPNVGFKIKYMTAKINQFEVI